MENKNYNQNNGQWKNESCGRQHDTHTNNSGNCGCGTGDKKSSFGEKAAEFKHNVGEKASEIKDKVTEKVGEYKEAAKDKIADMADKVKDAVKK